MLGLLALCLGLLLTLSACVAAGAGVVDIDVYRSRLEKIKRGGLPQTVRILDRDGALLAEILPGGYRTWVTLDAIPKALQQAVVATEDRTFFENAGIDQRAVARAAIQNTQAGGTVSGASTITMQLVRLMAFDSDERFEISMDRKIREVYLAAEIDEAYSKEEILEAYLNAAYFGNRAYGVEAAANRYFDKHVQALTVAESTLLAGLVQAPSALDPLVNLEGARQRQRTVLDSMVEAGYLDEMLAEVIWLSPLSFVTPEPLSERRAEHFVDYVLQRALPEMMDREALEQGGFVVTTSLDLDLQEDLRQIAQTHVEALRAPHDLSAASVVAIQPSTGEILAMVGGIDYDEPKDGQINMAAHPRQLGSTFKPIAYAEALEQGWTPASVLWDIPHRFSSGTGGTEYRPVNYDGRFRGPVRMRYALANSMNAAAIDLTAAIGFPAVHARALRMGLPLDEDPGRYGLSITLGAGDVPLIDMTGAYAAFANDGRLAEPSAVLRIDSMNGGNRRYVHEASPMQVVSPQTAYLISDMLSDAEARRLAFGDGQTLRLSRQAAVKTGTSNDFRDNTTIGYTREIAIGVWTGNKDNRPMRNVLGITGAAPIWKAAMERVFADAELMSRLSVGPSGDGEAFPRPPGIVDGKVCDLSTLTRDGSCRKYEDRFAASSSFRDEGRSYGWFVSPGGAGGCGQAAPAGSTQGQVYVILDRGPAVADVVRAWARRNGVQVAAPACSGS